MNVIFFKTSPEFLKKIAKRENGEFCAFWYTPGLASYENIQSVVNIERIFLEATIVDAFKKDYPYLSGNFPIVTFAENKKTVPGIKRICFLAANDTIVYSFKSFFGLNTTIKFKLFCKKGENAHLTAEKLNIPSVEIDFSLGNISQYSLLVMANDWGWLEQKINWDFINRKKNSICIQESIIDFSATDAKMRHCSIPVYEGIATLKCVDLREKVCAVIGNPRYESLQYSPPPLNKRVLINVNFTYGIYEEERQRWVDDVVNASLGLGMDYLISQHPRDGGDLTNYKTKRTNAGIVHDMIRESDILVSRFSSLIHEALCLGRPVIYYNPHHEKLFYDFEPDNHFLVYATNEMELRLAIETLAKNTASMQGNNPVLPYLKRHLGMSISGTASNYVYKFLQDAVEFKPVKSISLSKALKFTYETYKAKYWVPFKSKIKGKLVGKTGI